MTTLGDFRRGRLVRALLPVVLLAALAAPLATTAVAAAEDPPLDLAAIALTPDDLVDEGLDGFGVDASVLGSGESAARLIAVYRDQYDGEWAEAWSASDATRVHVLPLFQPVEPGDPDRGFANIVFCYALEYEDDEAAESGFADLVDAWGTGSTQEEETGAEVGDERASFRPQGDDPSSGNPDGRTDLFFRTGPLVLGVSLLSGVGSARTDTVEALAERLAARADTVVAGDAPGLSSQVLRLELGDVFPRYLAADHYRAIGGTDLRQMTDTDESLSKRQARDEALGIVDYYYVHLPLNAEPRDTSRDFLNSLRRFTSEDAASAWMESSTERLENDYEQVEVGDDPPDLGDEAQAISFRAESNARTNYYDRLDVRVGETVASLYFLVSQRASEPEPTGSTGSGLRELGAIQAECLVDGACLEPAPTPEGMTDPADDQDDRYDDVEKDADDQDTDGGPAGGGISGNRYISPVFGYRLEWDGDRWVAADTAVVADPPGDSLTLMAADGTSVLMIQGQERYAGDGKACLEAMGAESLGASGFDDVEPYDEGELSFSDPDRVHAAAYTFTHTDAEGVVHDGGIYVECRTLVEGEAVLSATYTHLDLAALEAGVADVQDVLATFELPT